MSSRRNPEDDIDSLLGRIKTQGMTDNAFQQAGQAPVDELFAGRNSALINDAAWDDLEQKARDELYGTRNTILTEDGYIDRSEGGVDDKFIRESVADQTGLHVYPGQAVNGQSNDSIFMYEFDDSGAALADGWRDGDAPATLGGLLRHDELYKHYPELQDLPLSIEALGGRLLGSYGGIDNEHGLGKMKLNSSMADKDIMDTVLHEAQHYIQRVEDWPGGGLHHQSTNENFAGWRPRRTEQWKEVAEENQDDLEAVRDQFGQEAYENISGEILARDVEQRYNTRNSLNAVIDQFNDPSSEINALPTNERDEVLARAEYTDNALGYYPAHPRDNGNSYPHDMPVSNPMTNPYVTRNAMATRHDNYGMKDDDTINSYYNADSLFEEALKQRKRDESIRR